MKMEIIAFYTKVKMKHLL